MKCSPMNVPEFCHVNSSGWQGHTFQIKAERDPYYLSVAHSCYCGLNTETGKITNRNYTVLSQYGILDCFI